MDDSTPNPLQRSNSYPQEQGDPSNRPTTGYQQPPFANFPPQFNPQLQPQFPQNFSPYGMPPNYHPYGGFHPGIPYEANFSFPPAGMFGRGAAIEGARSSSPVESMAYSHGDVGSGPASPISPVQHNNMNADSPSMDLAGGALPPIGSGADWKMEETTKASPRGKKRKVGVELFYYLGTGGACCCLTLDRINPPAPI